MKRRTLAMYIRRLSDDRLMEAGKQISLSLWRSPDTAENNPKLHGHWWYVRASTLHAINQEAEARGYLGFVIHT